MAQTEQLSLSWDAHQKSICNGLSQLQQRGEFVDMTLAADGHHVKVHQMVLSLVSPYIKELISTAQCPHPVIFLNNISYTTLCAILEYIYTGEVLVPKHRLPDLIAAGKALHIRGLREMDDTSDSIPTNSSSSPPRTTSISEKLRALREKKKSLQPETEKERTPAPMCKIYLDDEDSSIDIQDSTMDIKDSSLDMNYTSMDVKHDSTKVGETTLDSTGTLNSSNNGQSFITNELTAENTRKTLSSTKVHYTLSNQGGIMIIYNRYVYQRRHISKKNRKRCWRCTSYGSMRCPANIFTNDNDEVTDRISEHNHPFHDKQILKKYSAGAIFKKVREAEIQSDRKKKENSTRT